MAKMVPAWDKRTGRQLPNFVPKSWLDKGTFPRLSPTQQGAAAAQRPAPTGDTSKKKQES